MNILEDLFESKARARMMKLFMKNEEASYTKSEILQKTKLKEPQVRKELKILENIEYISERKKKGQRLFSLNRKFPFYKEFKEIIEKSEFVPDKKMVSELKQVGKVQYALIAGELINHKESEADLLIVGDNFIEKKLEDFLKTLEAEVGTEIRFSTMNTKEFLYRCDMFDRFTIELLRNPHRELVNTLPRFPKHTFMNATPRR